MSYLVFDIETSQLDLGTFDSAQQEYLLRGTADNDELREQRIGEMSLNPLTAQVVALGMLFVEGVGSQPKGFVYSNSEVAEPEQILDDGTVWREMTEHDLLTRWWKALEDKSSIHLISFNGRGFDCPFLMMRSAKLGIRPSRNLLEGTKWNYAKHTDLADELSFYGYGSSGATRRFSLDFYCKSFDIESPKSANMNGKEVPGYFREGRHREIAEYCMLDVNATWKLYAKWESLLKFESQRRY